MNFKGNCHCGAYRFELSADNEIKRVANCSCMLCKKQGYIWSIVEGDVLEIVRNDGKLVEYRSSESWHEASPPRNKPSNKVRRLMH